MMLIALTLTALAPSAPVAPASPPRAVVSRRVPEHGKLPWFRGSWEDLLAKAETSKRLIFLDFTADW